MHRVKSATTETLRTIVRRLLLLSIAWFCFAATGFVFSQAQGMGQQGGELRITTTSLPNGVVGVPYSAQLEVEEYGYTSAIQGSKIQGSNIR